MAVCILCGSSKTQDYYRSTNHYFLKCNNCASVFRHPTTFVAKAAEKTRYLSHKNDVNNSGYQNFVRPIVDAVTTNFLPTEKGLDFGAGTGPVITKLLSEKGYQLALYDPFFHPERTVLQTTYDFIVCCEVIEHFHSPLQEFKLLKNLLKPNGALFCMTDLWNDTIENFAKWYYKNDETHVIFYNKNNLAWTKEEVGFKNVFIKERLLTFINH